MKIVITVLSALFFITCALAQNFELTVNNGYGSGSYQAGDTCHIWSIACDTTKTFSHWTGDTQYLVNPHEWHTTLIMPTQNINVTSVVSNMPNYDIDYEQIMGANNLKNVYSCFPPNLKGVVYLFHGTGGKASNWINSVESRSFINSAIADSFGIFVTEAEEITLDSDLNGDGKLRWLTFPIDTLNGIDYLNIQTITDTFIQRGVMTNLTPKISCGMSNGGSFSAAISYVYNFQVGFSYCASSAQPIFNVRDNPFAFRMAKYDDNAEVGPQGNYQAWQNDSILQARNICHDYQLHDRQPIYPERFARISDISIETSIEIFNNLHDKGLLDTNNFALHSDTIKNTIIANPLLYPNIIALSPSTRIELLNQIAASNAEHKFFSDYNFETLEFIDNLCLTTVKTKDLYAENKTLHIYPNPANELINVDVLEGMYSIYMYNNMGQNVLHIANVHGLTTLDVSHFANGIYNIIVTDNKSVFTSVFVKE